MKRFEYLRAGSQTAGDDLPEGSTPREVDPNFVKEKEKEQRRIEAHRKRADEADRKWAERAKNKQWDQVNPHLSVYRFCGQEIKSDPRKTKEYVKLVLDDVNLAARDDLLEADKAVIAEVIERKASAFWIENTPRTTLRHLYHDTIPTGPPVRTPHTT